MAKNRRVVYRAGEGSPLTDRLPRPSDSSFYVFGGSVPTIYLPGPVARTRVSGPRTFGPPKAIKAAQGTVRPYSYIQSGLRIRAPRRVYFCISRKQRREVFHALGLAGERGFGKRGVRRTQNSQYRC